MPVQKSVVLFLAAALSFHAGARAQAGSATSPNTPPTRMAAPDAAGVPEGGVPRYIKPETPEQRLERLGTQEDPGPDPDPSKIFLRYGKQYQIDRVDRRQTKSFPTGGPGWVLPIAQLNIPSEIYQENDKYIWVWEEVVDPEATRKEALAGERPGEWSKEAITYYEELRGEFEPLDVPKAAVRVRFEESSAGLPPEGSWRNGAAVADMNEDGFPDLVLPPQRGMAATPSIFLGDGRGGWKRWAINFPRRFNYGSVVVADFNKDKHRDLGFSIHLTGLAVFLGDGKGGFREVAKGLEAGFPTRRLVATDVDADGWTDLVAISEGPVGRGKDVQDKLHGNLRAYLNRDRGRTWTGFNIAEPKQSLGGDFLSAGNFNGDKYPDFVGASVYFNSSFTMFLSNQASTYAPLLDKKVVPARSYYQATTAGRFVRGSKTDDAIVASVRYWPSKLPAQVVPQPPATQVSSIDRISFEGGQPKRKKIVAWSGLSPVRGIASADFDGDGILDIAYVTAGAADLSILLGDGTGRFQRAEVAGVTLPLLRTYDLLVSDFNGDKRPDVMVMFEAKQATAFSPKNGSVRVYLNRGPQVH